jgi:hypothetical protein
LYLHRNGKFAQGKLKNKHNVVFLMYIRLNLSEKHHLRSKAVIFLCQPGRFAAGTSSLRKKAEQSLRILSCLLFFYLSACSPQAAPTLFIAPHSPTGTSTAQASSTPETPIPPTVNAAPLTATASPALLPSATPTVVIPSPSETPSPTPSSTPFICGDSLKFLADLNFPDGTVVQPGKTFEKQWQVQNDGSCDWGPGYRLKLAPGQPSLGAADKMALFPARAGTKTTLSITFTAPAQAGTYRTVWQATNPEGIPFGESIYMEIIVQP